LPTFLIITDCENLYNIFIKENAWETRPISDKYGFLKWGFGK
jgi:hypothetical protein